MKLKMVIIAHSTSTLRSYPTRIDISLQGRNGQIMTDQKRTIDKSRPINQVGLLKKQEVEKIKSVIKQMLVD